MKQFPQRLCMPRTRRAAVSVQMEPVESRVHLSAAAAPSTIQNAETLMPAGNDMYVTSWHPQSGSMDLWMLHGDTDRGVLVKRSSGSIRPLIIYKDQLFFEAPTKAGKGLWKTNGTARGTSLIKPMPSDRNIGELAVVNGSLLFFTQHAKYSGIEGQDNGPDLWKTDGTRAGTVLLKALNPGLPQSTTAIGVVTAKRMLFEDTATWEDESGAVEEWHSVSQQTIFSTDGTIKGTIDLRQSNQWLESLRYQGLNKKFNMLSVPTAYNGVTYFLASTAAGNPGLWKKTKTGGMLLAQFPAGSHVDSFTPTDARVYFRVAAEKYNASELWSTDGTRAGTSMARSFIGSFTDLAPIGTQVYFSRTQMTVTATGGRVETAQIWRSNGKRGGTRRVFEESAPGSISAGQVTAAGDSLYFSADSGQLGRVVWHWNTKMEAKPHVVRPR